MNEHEHKERERFFGAAKVMSALTLASRILGMVRDMAIASLGATRLTSAFVLAFKIPNLFRRLFGEGALAAAFVPVFTETAERDGFDAAKRLYANAAGLLSAILAVLIGLAGLGLWAWATFISSEPESKFLLQLTVVMLPFVLTICLLALGAGALNCRGRFAYPALAPILLNAIIIVAAWFVAPLLRETTVGRLFIIAASVTVAGVVQVLIQAWLLKRDGFSVRMVLRPIEPGIKPMLKLFAPMLLGLGFLQLGEFAGDIIAWTLSATAANPTITLFGYELSKPLSEGVLMRVYTAQRLYQFPMGVLAISMAIAVFPLLSRYAARGDMPNLRDAVNRALRLSLMEGLAAGVGLFVLAEPIMRLIFVGRYSRFTAADAAASAFVLRMYAMGMWAYCALTILMRAFYALKDVVTPLKVSCALVVIGPILIATLVWMPWLGAGAFGVAMATTAGLNVAILTFVLRRRIHRLGGRKLLASVIRSISASGLMGATLVLLQHLLAGRSDLLVVGVSVPAGACVFLLCAWLLRSQELREILGRAAKPCNDDGENGTKQGAPDA